MGSKCVDCGHQAICSYRTVFEEMQKGAEDEFKQGKDELGQSVDADWVTVEVSCKHYDPRIRVRR